MDADLTQVQTEAWTELVRANGSTFNRLHEMKTNNLAIIVFSAMCLSCVSAQERRSAASDDGFSIAPAQLSTLKELAADGDSQAALRVSLHYSSGLNESAKDAAYWRTIAAENGDSVAQYNLWFLSRQSTNSIEQKRALFWLKKSAANGFEDAKKALDQISKKAEH